MYNLQKAVRDQVTIDKCTGRAAIRLRAAVKSMDESYGRINRYRIATAAICAETLGAGCPFAMQVFSRLITIERAIQTAVKFYWNSQQLVLQACEVSIFRRQIQFPEFDYPIVAANFTSLALSEQIEMLSHPPGPYSISMRYKSLRSTATLEQRRGDWHVRWSE